MSVSCSRIPAWLRNHRFIVRGQLCHRLIMFVSFLCLMLRRRATALFRFCRTAPSSRMWSISCALCVWVSCSSMSNLLYFSSCLACSEGVVEDLMSKLGATWAVSCLRIVPLFFEFVRRFFFFVRSSIKWFFSWASHNCWSVNATTCCELSLAYVDWFLFLRWLLSRFRC